MGHQSYILLAKDEEEVERIMSVIRNHNLHYDTLTEEQKKDDEYIYMTGEDLYHIDRTRLLKNKPKRYADYNHAILCCNGGGRSSTFNWFYKNNVECEGFMRQKWLSKKYRKIDL